MSELHALLEQVTDEHTFKVFARALVEEREAFERSEPSVDGVCGPWANNDISGFLEAGIAWADDSDFGAGLQPPISNQWAKFATFLWAGRSYE